jgi:hypothetical protein
MNIVQRAPLRLSASHKRGLKNISVGVDSDVAPKMWRDPETQRD